MKAWNAEEIEAYAELVGYGNPDFIEVKVRYLAHLKTETVVLFFANIV